MSTSDVITTSATVLGHNPILLTSGEELHFIASASGGLVATAAGGLAAATGGLVTSAGGLVTPSGGLVDDADDPSGPTAGQGQVVEVHPSVALVDAKYQPMTALHLTQEQPQYQQLQQPAHCGLERTRIET